MSAEPTLKLTSENVETVGKASMHKVAPENLDCAIKVEGIGVNFAFDPKRLAENREKIHELLDQLHPTFEEGWTFLNMCQDKDDQQWTSFHSVMDLLMCLGIAIGRVRYCLPREYWGHFPGGMPYILVKPREVPRGD